MIFITIIPCPTVDPNHTDSEYKKAFPSGESIELKTFDDFRHYCRTAVHLPHGWKIIRIDIPGHFGTEFPVIRGFDLQAKVSRMLFWRSLGNILKD